MMEGVSPAPSMIAIANPSKATTLVTKSFRADLYAFKVFLFIVRLLGTSGAHSYRRFLPSQIISTSKLGGSWQVALSFVLPKIGFLVVRVDAYFLKSLGFFFSVFIAEVPAVEQSVF